MSKNKRVGIYVDPQLYDDFRRFVALNFSEWLRHEMSEQVGQAKARFKASLEHHEAQESRI